MIKSILRPSIAPKIRLFLRRKYYFLVKCCAFENKSQRKDSFYRLMVKISTQGQVQLLINPRDVQANTEMMPDLSPTALLRLDLNQTSTI